MTVRAEVCRHRSEVCSLILLPMGGWCASAAAVPPATACLTVTVTSGCGKTKAQEAYGTNALQTCYPHEKQPTFQPLSISTPLGGLTAARPAGRPGFTPELASN